MATPEMRPIHSDERVEIKLLYPDGAFKKSMQVQPEFCTRYVIMPDGIKYEKVEGSDNEYKQLDATPATPA